MPFCGGEWFRRNDVEVSLKAEAEDESQFYSLIVFFHPKPGLPVLPAEHFDSEALKEGASWTVPAGYRAECQLKTSGDGAIQCELKVNDEDPGCAEGAHCQGSCEASIAGLAGLWFVTGIRWPIT